MEALETKIENGLQVLDKYETDLIALRESVQGLMIKGPEDREGYKAVREGRIALKNARVQVEKDGKALRENAVKFQKTVIKREDELIQIIAPAERNLQAYEEIYDNWQQEIRIEKERKENDRIQKRYDQLAKFGHSHDLYDLKIMPDDTFAELLTQVEIDHNAEQERLAKENAEAEALRIAEQQRLRVEREDLEMRQAEFKRHQEEQRKADLELAAAAKKEREYIEEQNRKKEAELKADREKMESERRAFELEKARKEAEERGRVEAEAKVKRDAEEKAERERMAKIEAQRQEALKPDKQKLFDYAATLMHIEMPVLSKQVPDTLITDISERVLQLAEYIHDRAQAL